WGGMRGTAGGVGGGSRRGGEVSSWGGRGSRGTARAWEGDVLNWARGAGPSGKRLLSASLGHRAGMDRRGGLAHHAVDAVRGRGAERLHRERPRADAAEPALRPAVG